MSVFLVVVNHDVLRHLISTFDCDCTTTIGFGRMLVVNAAFSSWQAAVDYLLCNVRHSKRSSQPNQTGHPLQFIARHNLGSHVYADGTKVSCRFSRMAWPGCRTYDRVYQ